MTTEIGSWRVEEATKGTVFAQNPGDHAWLFTGLTILLWIGWYLQRETGPFRPLDLGMAWGFFLISLLLLSLGWNRTEIRLNPQAAERSISPLPVLDGSYRHRRADVAGVHYWQQSVPAKRLDQQSSRPRFSAGIRLKNGSDIAVAGGLRSEEDAARAAEAIAKVWGMTPTRLPRGNEPTPWRGIFFFLTILCTPILVARVADFALALWQG